MLREKAKGELKPLVDAMKKSAETWLKHPPIVEEPPLYPPGTVSHSEEWRTLWHGAWGVAIQKLDPAAKLGFLYQLTQDKRYGELAVRILMEAAQWDPKGSTGYLYNDEAGMPYNYLFSRTYTFVHDLLTSEQRDKCREVMRIRGEEMYHHLCPDHLWHPYHSHQNRAWHFLGEVAIAFHDEIPEADDWLWFSMNVFANVYPVWNDSEGGWHEGLAYWRSYMERFSWWADVMKSATGIDAYRAPFFSQIGYYPMYVQPPGLTMGGFGDQTQALKSSGNTRLMSVFAAQAQNPYWKWYVDAHGAAAQGEGGYIGFVRAALYPPVEARPPGDLPSSRAVSWGGAGLSAFQPLQRKRRCRAHVQEQPDGDAEPRVRFAERVHALRVRRAALHLLRPAGYLRQRSSCQLDVGDKIGQQHHGGRTRPDQTFAGGAWEDHGVSDVSRIRLPARRSGSCV